MPARAKCSPLASVRAIACAMPCSNGATSALSTPSHSASNIERSLKCFWFQSSLPARIDIKMLLHEPERALSSTVSRHTSQRCSGSSCVSMSYTWRASSCCSCATATRSKPDCSTLTCVATLAGAPNNLMKNDVVVARRSENGRGAR